MSKKRPLVLGFDTSGPYCAAALVADKHTVVARHEPTQKGQAERLMPLLEEMLSEAGNSWRDLDAIGVGTGPGNFTGIRISVSAARGLALALGIPAIGVSLLDALAFDTDGPVLSSLDARRGQVYLQGHGRGSIADIAPHVADMDALPATFADPGVTCIGHRADEIAARLGARTAPAAFASASAIAHIAARRAAKPKERPAPLYIRPADAAPPRDAPPVLLQ